MPTGPFGPNLDPPSPQGRVRPFGVYRYPDPRNADRTIFEAWDHKGTCLSIASVANERATQRTEVDFWAWLETDLAPAVNDSPRPARPTPSFLRSI